MNQHEDGNAPRHNRLEQEPLVLDINGRRFAPKSSTVEDIYGYYEQRKGGVLLLNEKNEPFVFVVGNRWDEYFFVSCSQLEARLWYMCTTSDLDAKRLGLDEMRYYDRRALAERLVTQLRHPQASPVAQRVP
jgi:hypothetical protein